MNLARTAPTEHGDIRFLISEDPTNSARAVSCFPLVSRQEGLTHTIEALSNFYTPIFSPILAPGAEQITADEFARYVQEEAPNTDVVDLHPMDADSDFFVTAQQALQRRGYWTDKYFCFGNWYLEVQGRSYAEYFRGLSSKITKNVPRDRRRLNDLGLSIKLITSNCEDLDWAIKAYQEVYAKSWKRPEPYPDFIPGLCRLAAEKSWLRLAILSLGGAPVAAQLWLVKDGTASIYKLAYVEGYGKHSVGNILTCELMEYVIDTDKVSIVDYGMGDDPYKKEWMSHRRERHGLIAFNSRRPIGILAASRHFGGKRLKHLLNHFRNKK
ncbi:MAG: GNAT family N-acetyltransferase [Rhodocyclaceae bacterium]|nr:GNAT family N-acetyltransferase [Rhodocyclaceae bacterium]